MNRSETTAKIAAALAKAQGKFKKILKNQGASYPAKGGQMSYDYADLDAHLVAVRKPLAANGIALLTPTRNVITRTVGEEGYPVVIGTAFALVRLEHESGEFMESDEFAVPIVDALDARSIGSAATYARKYVVQGFLGVHPAEDDDDGAAARGGDHDQVQRPQQPQQQQRQATPQRPANQPQRQASPAPRQEQARQDPMPAARDFARAAEERQKADDFAARDLEIFSTAVAAGIPRDGFHAWAEKMIGRAYEKNTEWTEDDRAILKAEIAAQKELGGRGAPQLSPPKSSGRPRLAAVPVDTVTRSIPVKDTTDGTTRTATATSKV